MEFNGEVVMTVDTVDIRSEMVRYRPEDKMLDLPVPAEVLHPQGGIVCSEGRWSMQSETGWFVGRGEDQARFLDGAPWCWPTVWPWETRWGSPSGAWRCGIPRRPTGWWPTRSASAGERMGLRRLHIEVAMSGHAVAWLYEGDEPLRVSAPGMDITDGAEGRSLTAWSGAALHFGDVTAAADSLTWSEGERGVDLEGLPVLWNGGTN